jgi:hypothetical protein
VYGYFFYPDFLQQMDGRTCVHVILISSQIILLPYSNFLNRAKTLSQKVLGQDYVQTLLLSSIQQLYGRHHDIIERYEVLVSQMRINILRFYVSFTMWRVLYTEQDMLTHPKQLMSLPVFMTILMRHDIICVWIFLFIPISFNIWMEKRVFM